MADSTGNNKREDQTALLARALERARSLRRHFDSLPEHVRDHAKDEADDLIRTLETTCPTCPPPGNPPP